jgi:hypothetical protein
MRVPSGTTGALANYYGSVVPEGTLDFFVIETQRLNAGLLSAEEKTLSTYLTAARF